MPITAEQRERRRHHLGASDVAAVLGISPFQSAYDIFIQKTQRMDEIHSEAMDLGNRLEPVVLDWAEEQLGPLERNIELVSDEMPFMSANLDARVIESQNPVEAKTNSILWRSDVNWGDDGSSDVPDYIAVQAYAQMFVAQRDTCFVPALIGGRGFSLFSIPRDESTMKLILEHCQDFWENCVLKGIPPADSTPSLDVVKRIQREPGNVVTLADELIERWKEAQEAAKIAKEAAEAAEAAQATVIAALGDAEDGKCSLGNVTYHMQTRASYVVKETSFRVLRLVKPKKGGK